MRLRWTAEMSALEGLDFSFAWIGTAYFWSIHSGDSDVYGLVFER